MTIEVNKFAEDKEKLVESLRSFVNSPGWESMKELIAREKAQALADFMTADEATFEQLLRIQANLKAWKRLEEIIPGVVKSHDKWVEQTIEMHRKTEEHTAEVFNYRSHLDRVGAQSNSY